MIDKTYPLGDAADAHRDLEGRKTTGKFLIPDSIMTTEETRRARAASLLEEAKLDALLVTNLHNVRYLTGFTGSNGACCFSKQAGRPVHRSALHRPVEQQANCTVRIAKGPLTKSILQEIGRGRVSRWDSKRTT